MSREHYPSDLSDEEWTILEPLIPPAKPGGRPRTTNMREVLNGIFYVNKGGIRWRMLPQEFPRWETVYYYSNTWRKAGCGVNGTASCGKKSAKPRDERPHPAPPSSIAKVSKRRKKGPRGFDGATLVKGRKRHILVDTLGLLLKGMVSEANVTERDGAAWLLLAIVGLFSRLQVIGADGGYRGVDFVAWVKRCIGFDWRLSSAILPSKAFRNCPDGGSWNEPFPGLAMHDG